MRRIQQIVFAMVFASSVASNAATPRDEAKIKARELIVAATEDFKMARYETAAEKYLAAHELVETHELSPKPELLFNAGLCFERLGRCDEVARLFSKFLRARPQLRVGDLQFRHDNARRCAPPLTFVTEPPGATVWIDDRPRGITPLRVHVVRGGHVVRVLLDGYAPGEDAIVVEEGQPQTVSFELVPQDRPARLAVTIPEGVRVKIDGGITIRGPRVELMSMEEGPHTLRAEREGCEPVTTTVTLIAGEEPEQYRAEVPPCAAATSAPRIAAETSPPPRARAAVDEVVPTTVDVSPWTWALGVTGAGTLVSSLVFGIVSAQASSSAEFEMAKPVDLRDQEALDRAEDHAQGFLIGAATAAVVGAGLLIGTVVHAALDTDDDDLVTVTPTGVAVRW